MLIGLSRRRGNAEGREAFGKALADLRATGYLIPDGSTTSGVGERLVLDPFTRPGRSAPAQTASFLISGEVVGTGRRGTQQGHAPQPERGAETYPSQMVLT
ncbi:hypothetical protein ACFWQ6_22200 [Streptomyces coelicoflavus]|uniref:hypothetical protein n=1 Tax=Streptomyces coelicoflavus TaxID=285562 RepID=UPI001EF253A4|nr:hypothetical protein [Streptomyces coelicoflavus]